ncbi:ubiquinol-cytochrome c reductase iron-sulfur subunit [Brachybacterium sp. GCM10030267]|uniref:QcrA and Rieske domain-containing protein n=1 Tax=Brachybacterium sp. GCM10030267 TaxID=3273381 RepID=UPI00360AEE59
MERPCLSRRRALLLPASAAAVGGLASCAPEDEGFGTAEPVRAEDGAVPLEDVPENASTLVNFGGQRPFVLLVRGSGDDLAAYSGYCTHNGCALRQETEGELDCPCHGSRFDAETGDVLLGPATTHLPEVSVVVQDGLVRRAS